MLPKSSVGWGGWVEAGERRGAGGWSSPSGSLQGRALGWGVSPGGSVLVPPAPLGSSGCVGTSDLSFNLFFISIKHP